MKKDKKDKKDNKITKNLINNFILWTLIIVISITVLNYVDTDFKSEKITYSEFSTLINDDSLNKSITKAIIDGRTFNGECITGCFIGGYEEPIKKFKVVLPEVTIEKIDDWNNLLGGTIDIEIIEKTPGFMDYVFQFSPWILIILFWFFIMRRMNNVGGGQGGIFSFAKSKAKIISSENPKTLFSDVAGCDEAKT